MILYKHDLSIMKVYFNTVKVVCITQLTCIYVVGNIYYLLDSMYFLQCVYDHCNLHKDPKYYCTTCITYNPSVLCDHCKLVYYSIQTINLDIGTLFVKWRSPQNILEISRQFSVDMEDNTHTE